MPIKPNVSSQLMGQTGLGRPGVMMSSGSAPSIMQSTKGSGFAAMENTLLKGPKPAPKALSGGSSGRQYFTQAAGGDLSTGLPKSPKVFKTRMPKMKIK